MGSMRFITFQRVSVQCFEKSLGEFQRKRRELKRFEGVFRGVPEVPGALRSPME